MNIFEIAIGELVSLLGILRVTVINAQMPFCVFAESAQSDKLVFLICRRSMFAPCTFSVRDNMFLVDEPHGKRKDFFV